VETLAGKASMSKLMGASPDLLVWIVDACDVLTQQARKHKAGAEAQGVGNRVKNLSKIATIVLKHNPPKGGIKKRCDVSHVGGEYPCCICKPIYWYVYESTQAAQLIASLPKADVSDDEPTVLQKRCSDAVFNNLPGPIPHRKSRLPSVMVSGPDKY